MEKIFIFLRRVCDITAQITGSSDVVKFPFYNHRHCGSCKTETIYTNIPKVPTCRIETSTFNNSISDLSAKIRDMRLSCNFTAAELSRRTGVHTATISRYENDNFSYDMIDIDTLSILAVSCGKDVDYLLSPYLKFKKYHKDILQQFLIDNKLSKRQLAELCCVSYTLVKTWFNKEKRSPSYEVWQTTFREYSLNWFAQKVD